MADFVFERHDNGDGTYAIRCGTHTTVTFNVAKVNCSDVLDLFSVKGATVSSAPTSMIDHILTSHSLVS